MRKYLLTLLTIILCSGATYAQFNLSGSIRSEENNEMLRGANIRILELNIGTASNTHGLFMIRNLNAGEYTIEISHVGYETNRVKISLQKNITKNISLIPVYVELETTIVTATRTSLNKADVPAKTDIISKTQIADYPATSFDELFRSIPNVVVNRSWGMFSKNSSVTMRGMDASSRSLILYNGTPINKAAGGSIIWDMINPESVERVEIIKGPGSALYGNNAMGGMINIITRTPENQTIRGSISTYGGTYDVYGGNLNLGQKIKSGGHNIFWQLNSSYTDGQGYILEPEDSRSEYDTKAYVKEASINLKSGIEFNENQSITLEYSYYDGKHGAGTKVYAEDGAYDQYFTNLFSGKYAGNLNGFNINANIFSQWQDYNIVDENMGNKGYMLSKTHTDTHDYGLFLNVSKQWGNHRVLGGMDLKNGMLDAKNNFFNESSAKDLLEYQGQLFFNGLFIQDEISIIPYKFQAILGFRFDHAKFSNAFLNVTDPTSFSGFAASELFNYAGNSWHKFSPRISLLWKFSDKNSIYASYTSGFMPPKLDDMVRTGVVTKGYKMANPELKPESITSIEFGSRLEIAKKLYFEPAVYYSWADDMVYFIETGEKVITSGNKLKPVLQKRNISKVEIYGFESSFNYELNSHINFKAAYTYNHSTIKKFYDDNTAQDFEGKFLIEVPKHQASLSAYWKNKIANISMVYNFTGRQWYDDLNTEYVDEYHTIDLKLNKPITRNLAATLTIQNLLDDEFIDRKGLLSPGRFILMELKYKI